MGIGKVLNYLGVRNLLDTKLHVLGACKCLSDCLFISITVVDSMVYGAKSAHRGIGTEWHIKYSFLYWFWFNGCKLKLDEWIFRAAFGSS